MAEERDTDSEEASEAWAEEWAEAWAEASAASAVEASAASAVEKVTDTPPAADTAPVADTALDLMAGVLAEKADMVADMAVMAAVLADTENATRSRLQRRTKHKHQSRTIVILQGSHQQQAKRTAHSNSILQAQWPPYSNGILQLATILASIWTRQAKNFM